MTTENAIKDFGRLLEIIDRSKSLAENFRDFLDFALWVFDPSKDRKEYDSKDLFKLLDLWSIASEGDGSGFADALGDIFMEHISYGKAGQYFTPQPICEMMAAFTVGDSIADGTPIADPSGCGSGRMLLAAARINRRARFYGADTDLTCCKMTALNMLINSMVGEVAWMNTLTGEHYKSYCIDRILMPNMQYLPCFQTLEGGDPRSMFMQQFEEMAQRKPPTFKDSDLMPQASQMVLF